MPEEQEDVQPDSSPETTPVNVVQEQQENQADDIQPQGVGQPPIDDDVDERGVPFRNVAMEYRRKFEETDRKLSTVLETLQKQEKSQSQEYTVEQLEAFAHDPDTKPQDRVWALSQAEQKKQQRLEKLLDEKLNQTETQRRNNEIRQRAVQYVAQKHSDVFLRNENGQFVTDHQGRMQWNPKSDKARLMVQYLQDERVSSQPDSYQIAAKLAAADLMEVQKPQQKQQVQKLREENKQLQKATMIEGGGQRPIDVSPIQSATENFKQTGKVHDLAQALKARRSSRTA